uniref:UDP-N-acetylglucosamine transporter n=2 Tax=Steinernema glaseri TaxID=37863 RepID=A0A1I7ZGC2_9BILA
MCFETDSRLPFPRCGSLELAGKKWPQSISGWSGTSLPGAMSTKDDRELLLPTDDPKAPIGKRRTDQVGLGFKVYVIVTMTVLWSGYTLSVRYTRSTTPPDQLYASTTVVFLAEAVKLLIAIFFIFKDSNFDVKTTKKLIDREFFQRPKELLKMSVPSLTYALQNNLDFVALSNLDAGVYQVTAQLKVVTTALFMMAFLGRRFSTTRWFGIILLFCGVAAVQYDAAGSSSSKPVGVSGAENYTLGLVAVLSTCITAGFAGVYFEKMLKDGGSTPFWVRNLQMYSCGVVSAGIACFVGDGELIATRGFFHGYDVKVLAIVGCLSVGGVYISLVMKHLDNLYKSFAAAVSIICVVILSIFLFDNVVIGLYFLFGSMTVCAAICIYNSVNE